MVQENGSGTGEKALDIERGLKQSVIDRPGEAPISPSLETSLIWFVAGQADDFPAWGKTPKTRDKKLREFITKENLFGSALGSVCARNAAFSWTLEGPPRAVQQVQDVFEGANQGKGWVDLCLKVSMDLYSQDSGAFIEVVRETNSPNGKLIGLNHLDAAKCYHTGVPQEPVIYEDRKSRYHVLPWYNVIPLAELPTPIEHMYGMQICAESRLLLAAQIIRNIAIYRAEKTGGRFNRAIHLIRGITTSSIHDALAQARTQADNEGLLRYIEPLLVSGVDPKAEIGVQTIELASMPDGFDEEKIFKHYISQIALAFLTDYQEFAPLPGGNLGTSAQSEVLHMKSRGKGPGLFMKLLSHALNFQVLPASVSFKFDEQDLEAEKQEADVKKQRADTRKVNVDAGILSPEAARQQALDDGDISQELFDAMGGMDVTPNVNVPDEERTPDEAPVPANPSLPAGELPTQDTTAGAGVKHLGGKHNQKRHSGAGGAEALAGTLINKAAAVESGMTGQMMRISGSQGGSMAGLENRLKSKDSLTRKLKKEFNENPDWSMSDVAAKDTNDVLRYTMVFGEKSYSRGVNGSLKDLKSSGVEVVKVKNYWPDAAGKEYKGVNAVLKVGTQKVELQFHTPRSLDVKQLNHTLYEEARAVPKTKVGRQKAATLASQMAANTSPGSLPRPPGTFAITGSVVPRP